MQSLKLLNLAKIRTNAWKFDSGSLIILIESVCFIILINKDKLTRIIIFIAPHYYAIDFTI